MAEMRIRELREAQGLTLQQVADRLKTNVSTVSRWERDAQRVTVPVLRDLAVALGCSPAELIAFTPEPDEEGKIPAASVLAVAYLRTVTSRPPKDLAVFTMPVESMEPTIKKGELVLVDLADRVLGPGGMFGIHREGIASVRRISPVMFKEPGLVDIRADNPLFPPYQWVWDELPILGRVLWHGGRV